VTKVRRNVIGQVSIWFFDTGNTGDIGAGGTRG